MMGKQRMLNNTDVLTASEIGQYTYCSYSWFLQRCGYRADSPALKSGKQAHIAVGNKIDAYEKRMRRARWYTILGVIALFIGVLLLVFGVVI